MSLGTLWDSVPEILAHLLRQKHRDDFLREGRPDPKTEFLACLIFETLEQNFLWGGGEFAQ